jgi:hypothetical protein
MSETTGPLAYPKDGRYPHYPAGWTSPAEAERVERIAVAQEIAREQEAAERAAREQAISERIASRRAGQAPAAVEPESGGKPEPGR